MRWKAILILTITVVASGCLSTTVNNYSVTETRSATITEVVDGDTVDLNYSNKVERIRLDGIDTPEVHIENDPAKYPGISETAEGKECLDKWGEKASSFVKNETEEGENIILSYKFENGKPERGSYGRILGEILYKNSSLNRQLVIRGYARTYSEESPYLEEEETAIQNSDGLWSCQSLS
ncbi:MAG: hypothetical protein BRC29_04385 [Nanohaloarchaea archaeon SW_7_43_1]|nr:MAG: hypothetical protein BRC29_04385 [Nanohaloarchaea archaeon SW_7_43_1]